MKKLMFLLVICLCIILTGCGSKKEEKKVVKEEPVTKINLKLGNTNQTFTSNEVTCGSYTIQSNVVFTNELDNNNEYKGSYELYECNEGNVNLETASGTYIQDDEIVTFTDSYGQKLSFEITDNDTIVLKNGSKIVQTFTK